MNKGEYLGGIARSEALHDAEDLQCGELLFDSAPAPSAIA